MKVQQVIKLSGLLLAAPLVTRAAVAIGSGPLNALIPDQSNTGVAYTLTVPDSFPISAVSVSLSLSVPAGSTGWFGDLYAYLQHDSGLAVLLNRPGRDFGSLAGYDDSQNVAVTFDDAAANGDIHNYRFALFGDETTPLTGGLTGLWQPDGRAVDPAVTVSSDLPTAMLSQFSGLNSGGVWTLFIADLSGGGEFQLDGWNLQLDGTVPPTPGVPEASTWAAGVLLSAAMAVALWRRRRGD